MPDRRLEPGQRTVARLIIRLCINTGEQTDHPSGQAITRVVATGDRKQFQYLQIVFNNKTRSLVLEFN